MQVTQKIDWLIDGSYSLLPRPGSHAGLGTRLSDMHVELHVTLNQDWCRSSYTLNKVKISLAADTSTGMHVLCPKMHVRRKINACTHGKSMLASFQWRSRKLGNKVSPICAPQHLVIYPPKHTVTGQDMGSPDNLNKEDTLKNKYIEINSSCWVNAAGRFAMTTATAADNSRTSCAPAQFTSRSGLRHLPWTRGSSKYTSPHERECKNL